MDQVDISKIRKQLKKVPKEIRVKFQQWVLYIEEFGLLKAQKFPSFRDHPLKGQRKGQRSVYLTKKWRAVYTLDKRGQINIVLVEEVMPHDY